MLSNTPLSGGADRTQETECRNAHAGQPNHTQVMHLLDSFLQTISRGFLSHSPVARQVAAIISSGNSP